MTDLDQTDRTGVGVLPVNETRPAPVTLTKTSVETKPIVDETPPPPVVAPPPQPTEKVKDVRYLALRNFAISMTVLNILGYTVLGFEQPWTWPIFAILLGYSLEITIEMISAWSTGRRAAFLGNGMRGLFTFLLPAHITSLAVNLLLYSNTNFWPVAFGIVVGIGQKAVFRAPINGRMRHFMNPSNLGITCTLLVFSWVNMVPPYHFTESIPDVFRLIVPTIIITAGTILNAQLTKKTMLIVGWLGGFVIQSLVRHFVWDVALWAALGTMTGVAFILFTNYMITDPGTSPSPGRAQFMFGASVATVYGVLMVFNIVYTLFFAVTIVCGVRGIYWWVRWLRDHHTGDADPSDSPVPTAALQTSAR